MVALVVAMVTTLETVPVATITRATIPIATVTKANVQYE